MRPERAPRFIWNLDSNQYLLERVSARIDGNVRVTCTEEQKSAINKALADFVNERLAYDLHEMVPDEDMQAMAQDCENIRRELCEWNAQPVRIPEP